MKMLGLMRVKNVDRWLEASLRSQRFCDHVIILDDNSTDMTAAVCAEFNGWVTRIPKSYQREHDEKTDREFLAAEAAKYNPEWICSLSGDEVLFEDTWDLIKPALQDSFVIEVLNLHLWNNDYTVRVDNNWDKQYRQSFWRFKQGPLTYALDHCSLPNEITERPFTRVGARALHYGNMDPRDRMRRYKMYQTHGYEWDYLIQGDVGGPPAGDLELKALEEML